MNEAFQDDRLNAARGRCEAARAHIMRAARDVERFAEAHAAMMFAADAIEEADTKVTNVQTRLHLQAEAERPPLKLAPTPWKR